MKARPHWKKRKLTIGKVVGDPECWDYLAGANIVLATVKRSGSGFAVSLPNGETAGPFGDLALAKQAGKKRAERAQAGLSPWSPPAPGG